MFYDYAVLQSLPVLPHSFPTRRSSDLLFWLVRACSGRATTQARKCQRSAQLRKSPFGAEIPFRDIGYKLDLSQKVVSDHPNKEKTGRHSSGYPTASLLRADRRKREPGEGLPPALGREAEAQQAHRGDRGHGRKQSEENKSTHQSLTSN